LKCLHVELYCKLLASKKSFRYKMALVVHKKVSFVSLIKVENFRFIRLKLEFYGFCWSIVEAENGKRNGPKSDNKVFSALLSLRMRCCESCLIDGLLWRTFFCFQSPYSFGKLTVSIWTGGEKDKVGEMAKKRKTMVFCSNFRYCPKKASQNVFNRL
jgi:hypothetical protein